MLKKVVGIGFFSGKQAFQDIKNPIPRFEIQRLSPSETQKIPRDKSYDESVISEVVCLTGAFI